MLTGNINFKNFKTKKNTKKVKKILKKLLQEDNEIIRSLMAKMWPNQKRPLDFFRQFLFVMCRNTLNSSYNCTNGAFRKCDT